MINYDYDALPLLLLNALTIIYSLVDVVVVVTVVVVEASSDFYIKCKRQITNIKYFPK